MKQDTVSINKIIVTVLRWGSGVSIILMAAGLGLFLINGCSAANTYFTGFHQVLTGVLAFDPAALMTGGIICLLLTPFLRVAGAFLSFLLIEKDKPYALISLGVLIILVISLFIPELKFKL